MHMQSINLVQPYLCNDLITFRGYLALVALCVTPVTLPACDLSHAELPHGWEEAYTDDGRKYFIK